MPCKTYKKKYRKECYARKTKEKTQKRKHKKFQLLIQVKKLNYNR